MRWFSHSCIRTYAHNTCDSIIISKLMSPGMWHPRVWETGTNICGQSCYLHPQRYAYYTCAHKDTNNTLLLLLLLSPSCRVFINTFLTQTMFLQYILLQLFCIYNLYYMYFILHMTHVLYFYINTPDSKCAVPSMAVFRSSLTSCFPGMLIRYCLSDSEMLAVVFVNTTGITFAFTFHMCWIYIMRSLYFKIFSAAFLKTYLSPEIATSINIHVPFLLSLVMKSSLLLGIVLLVRICWFHNMVTLPS